MVLADKGFNIHDLLAKKGASLVIPPFKNKKNQEYFCLDDETRGKIIAKARIFVEIWNYRMKLYKYLGNIIPQQKFTLLKYASFVCAILANFSSLLVKNE